MNKKLLLVFLAAFFAFSGPLSALAQETGSSATTAPRVRLQNVRDRAQNLREKAGEKRAEAKAKLEERRIQNIRKFFVKMGRRLEAAISRLEKMADKIASRLKRFEARGGKVDEAKAKLDVARAKINEAKQAYADAKLKLEVALKSDTPKAAFEKVREGLAKGVVGKIKEAHEALVEAVKVLKGTGLGGDAKATSTSNSNQ